MRDILHTRSCGDDVSTMMSDIKDFLGSRAYTVEHYDREEGCLTARKTSTLLVLLGMDRSLAVRTRMMGPNKGAILELHWKGVLKGCLISFIEAFMLTLIIGRDLGLQGLLISFLLGAIGSTINLAIHIVQRVLLRRAVSNFQWSSKR